MCVPILTKIPWILAKDQWKRKRHIWTKNIVKMWIWTVLEFVCQIALLIIGNNIPTGILSKSQQPKLVFFILIRCTSAGIQRRLLRKIRAYEFWLGVYGNALNLMQILRCGRVRWYIAFNTKFILEQKLAETTSYT